MSLVKIQNLGKKYSQKADFTIENINIVGNAGEIIGILGHNGAGKSTTIKCITGMHPYEAGSIHICGYEMMNEPIEAKRNFGYVSDDHVLFEKMTGYEFINFMADIYKVSQKDRKERVENFQNLFQLGDSIYNPISSYSHGEPKISTGIITFGLSLPSALTSLIARSKSFTSILKVLGSESINIGVAPLIVTHSAEATKVNDDTNTASPAPIPHAIKVRVKASVPEPLVAQYFEPA